MTHKEEAMQKSRFKKCILLGGLLCFLVLSPVFGREWISTGEQDVPGAKTAEQRKIQYGKSPDITVLENKEKVVNISNIL